MAALVAGRRVAGVTGIGRTAIQEAKAQGTGNSELVGRWLDVAGTNWRVISEIREIKANESIRTFTIARHFADGSVVERVAVKVAPQGNEKRRWRDSGECLRSGACAIRKREYGAVRQRRIHP